MPAGDSSVCHFPLSFSHFLIFPLLPAFLPFHLWYLHSAGAAGFQLRPGQCAINCGCNSNVTLWLFFIARCKKSSPFVALYHNQVKCQGQLDPGTSLPLPPRRFKGLKATLDWNQFYSLKRGFFEWKCQCFCTFSYFNIWQVFVKHAHGSVFVLHCHMLGTSSKSFKLFYPSSRMVQSSLVP